MASSICWKFHFGVYSAYLLCNHNNSCCLCLAFTLKFISKHLPAGSLIYSGKWHLTTAKITSCLWLSYYTVYCMLGYSGKLHHLSVGKFTVVYTVHIHYAMTIIFGACVFLFL